MSEIINTDTDTIRITFTPQELNLEVDYVLMGEGADPYVLRRRNPGLVAQAEQALTEGLNLLKPQLALRILDVGDWIHQRVNFIQGGSLVGKAVVQHLAGAKQIALMVYTIGPLIDEKVKAYMNDEPGLAIAYDGLGNAAVEILGSLVFKQLEKHALKQDWQLSILLSPGMIGWELEQAQLQIFNLLDAARVGVHINEACLMIPRKSSSAVAGMGPDVVPAQGLPCEYCSLNDHCRYKGYHGRVV